MKASLTDFVFWFPGILIHHTRREHVDTAKGRLEEIDLIGVLYTNYTLASKIRLIPVFLATLTYCPSIKAL